MFNFFKPKSLFEKYYKEIISISAVKSGEYYKPITAAYLYTVSEIMFNFTSDIMKGIDYSHGIYDSIIRFKFTKKDIDVFNQAINVLTNIKEERIPLRADWMLKNIDIIEPIKPVLLLFYSFGDLLFNPKLLYDYTNSPILLKPINEVMDFMLNFNSIFEITRQYMLELKRSF